MKLRFTDMCLLARATSASSYAYNDLPNLLLTLISKNLQKSSSGKDYYNVLLGTNCVLNYIRQSTLYPDKIITSRKDNRSLNGKPDFSIFFPKIFRRTFSSSQLPAAIVAQWLFGGSNIFFIIYDLIEQ